MTLIPGVSFARASRLLVTLSSTAALVAMAWPAPPARAADPEPKPAEGKKPLPHIASLPLVDYVLTDGGMAKAPAAQLLQTARHMVQRLMLDEQSPELNTPVQLHQLVTAATAVQQARALGDTSPESRVSAVWASFMLHSAGHAYTTRPAAQAALARLPSTAQNAHTKRLFELISASVPKMHEAGRAWFPEALQEALAESPKNAVLHNLRGLWLMREGKPADAVTAFEGALKINPSILYAVNLHEALLAADRDSDAAGLARQIIRNGPGLAGQLENMQRHKADGIATEAYEAAPKKASLDDRLAQVLRYERMNRGDAAVALLAELVRTHSGEAKVLELAGEVYTRMRKFEALTPLLEAAAKRGELPLRLLEARIAAVAEARVQRARGQKVPKLADHDLEADLEAYLKRRGPAGDMVTRAVRAFVALSEALAAQTAGKKVPEATAKLVETVISEGFAKHGSTRDMVRLAIGSYLGLGEGKRSMEIVQKHLPKASASDRPALALLLARLETGYGIRTRDSALLQKAIDRLDDVEREKGKLSPFEKRLLAYTQVVAKVARAGAHGRTKDLQPLLVPGLETLDGLLKAFDETDQDQRVLSGAVTVSMGALALAAKNIPLAHDATKRGRMLPPDSRLTPLVAGQAAIIVGDNHGGWDFLTGIAERVDRADLRFMYQKWRALAANNAGDAPSGVMAMKAMLKEWPEAEMPTKIEDGVPFPAFVGDFNIEVGFKPGQPLEARFRTNPVPLLLPDFAHDKAAVLEMVDKLDGAKGVADP